MGNNGEAMCSRLQIHETKALDAATMSHAAHSKNIGSAKQCGKLRISDFAKKLYVEVILLSKVLQLLLVTLVNDWACDPVFQSIADFFREPCHRLKAGQLPLTRMHAGNCQADQLFLYCILPDWWLRIPMKLPCSSRNHLHLTVRCVKVS